MSGRVCLQLLVPRHQHGGYQDHQELCQARGNHPTGQTGMSRILATSKKTRHRETQHCQQTTASHVQRRRLYTCMYVCICTCTCTHMYMCTHVHVHTHTCTCTHTLVFTQLHTLYNVHTHDNTHTYSIHVFSVYTLNSPSVNRLT